MAILAKRMMADVFQGIAHLKMNGHEAIYDERWSPAADN